MNDQARPIEIYVDADACPVKDEIYRVAGRYGLKVFVVANAFINVPRDPMIERVVVGQGMDEADNWIAERAVQGDVVITADVPLASRAFKAGAAVIAPNGKAFDANSIGMTVATRNLLHELRSAGEITGGPRPFSPQALRTKSTGFDAYDLRMFLGSPTHQWGETKSQSQSCFQTDTSVACTSGFASAFDADGKPLID